MEHYLRVSRVLYLWNFLMDKKNIYHMAEAVRTRAKGLACIHMAKLSLPLLNIMDSSILTSGNSPCLMLSLEQSPGMLASPGHPNNIDIEGSVFTAWFPEQCRVPAVNQQRISRDGWATVPASVCWHCWVCWCEWGQRSGVWAASPWPLTRPGEQFLCVRQSCCPRLGCCNMHAHVPGSAYFSLSFLCKAETL